MAPASSFLGPMSGSSGSICVGFFPPSIEVSVFLLEAVFTLFSPSSFFSLPRSRSLSLFVGRGGELCETSKKCSSAHAHTHTASRERAGQPWSGRRSGKQASEERSFLSSAAFFSVLISSSFALPPANDDDDDCKNLIDFRPRSLARSRCACACPVRARGIRCPLRRRVEISDR